MEMFYRGGVWLEVVANRKEFKNEDKVVGTIYHLDIQQISSATNLKFCTFCE